MNTVTVMVDWFKDLWNQCWRDSIVTCKVCYSEVANGNLNKHYEWHLKRGEIE